MQRHLTVALSPPPPAGGAPSQRGPRRKAPLTERFLANLLIHTLIILPVLLRGQTRGILEHTAEMGGGHKAGLFRNVGNALVRFSR